MHAMGNDFVVFDKRSCPPKQPLFAADSKMIHALGDRHCGIGFDQMAIIAAPMRNGAHSIDADLIFYNANGLQAATCGNATRCIADYMMHEAGTNNVRFKTGQRIVCGERSADNAVRIDMGAPTTDWQTIPLAWPVDTLSIPIRDVLPLALQQYIKTDTGVASGLGNPHCTVLIKGKEAHTNYTKLAKHYPKLGAHLEKHPLYPERTNVEFVQIVDRHTVRALIWERGVGVTQSSGSCGCAAAIAAIRCGLCQSPVTVHMLGGALHVDWQGQSLWMQGAVAYVFDGVLTQRYLADLAHG